MADSSSSKKVVTFNELAEVYYQEETETTLPEYFDDTEMDFSELLPFSAAAASESYEDDWHECRDFSNSRYEDCLEETSVSEPDESNSEFDPIQSYPIMEVPSPNSSSESQSPDIDENDEYYTPVLEKQQSCRKEEDDSDITPDRHPPPPQPPLLGFGVLAAIFAHSFWSICRCLQQHIQDENNAEDDAVAIATLAKGGGFAGGGNPAVVPIQYVHLIETLETLLVARARKFSLSHSLIRPCGSLFLL
jgi:hypothetical protein